jgi:septal ring factor EnvC (AmiA/AmiB activator)
MKRILISVFCLLMSAAQSAPAPQGGTLNQRYERARQALEQQRAAEEETRAAHDLLAHEAEDLRQKLVANAARVQELEAAFAATETEIEDLRAKETELASSLGRDRDRVARLLAVLQRLDADNPPALALRPDDSLAAARGTMMLGSMLPPVYQEAYALRRQVAALRETRASLETKNTQAHNEAQALASARAELSLLLDSRSQQANEAQEKLAELHEVTEEIGRQTSDLRSLIDRIAGLRAQAGPAQGMVVVTSKAPGSAKNSPAEALQRGSLLRPVVGTAIPGDSAGPGRTPGTQGSGLWFETAASAQAVAPADSEVVFAGAYQKFGQVLILEMPGGYHLLLAGLDRIDVHIGDLVLAGEPVGVLPGGSTARLYLELRRNGQTVDPLPWMSAELRKAKG